MKLDPPANSNYAAVVVRLPKLLELAGCDNLLGAPLLGFQAIVSKDHAQGDLGVVFPAECQLHEDYVSINGLYRHSELNKDSAAKGYLEDNRRVRAIKLRGHRSDCLFMPLESLAYTRVNLSELKEGDVFDRLGDHDICKKYVIKTREPRPQRGKQVKRFVRVDPRLFSPHLDTENYFRYSDRIAPDQWIYVTQKVHGISGRWSRSYVLRQLRLRDRIAKKLGVHVSEYEWDVVAGSRKVIKDPLENRDARHHYGYDIWTHFIERIESVLPENFVVYGELIGWTADGAAIQTDYTYRQPPKTHALVVYRVTMVNPRGVTVDLSWPQVKEWCGERGLDTVPQLWEGFHRDFVAEDWLDRRFRDEGFMNAIPLGDNKKIVDEGVCIRVDGLVPFITKAKSSIFLRHESAQFDKGESDIESAQSEDEA